MDYLLLSIEKRLQLELLQKGGLMFNNVKQEISCSYENGLSILSSNLEVTFSHKGAQTLLLTTAFKYSASGPQTMNPHKGNAAVWSISSQSQKHLRNLYEPSAAFWRDIEGKPRPFKKVHLMDSEPVTPEPETACSSHQLKCTSKCMSFRAGDAVSLRLHSSLFPHSGFPGVTEVKNPPANTGDTETQI